MKLFIKLLLIIIVSVCSFIISVTLDSLTTKKIDEIRLEEETLHKLKILSIETKEKSVQLVSSHILSNNWINFTTNINSLGTYFDYIDEFEIIPNLNDQLHRELMRIVIINELTDFQFNSLNDKYKKLITLLESTSIYDKDSFSYYDIYKNADYRELENYTELHFIGISFELEIKMFNSFLDASINSINTQLNKISTSIDVIKKRWLQISTLISSFFILMAIIISLLISNNIVKDTKKVITTLKAVGNEEVEINFDVKRKDEIGILVDELKVILTKLFETKKQLYNQRKLNSLSYLTMGLAHEINTPLGVCVTAISYITENLKDSNNVSDEMFDLLSLNISKIVKLVNSFKNISNDSEYVISRVDIVKHIKTYTKDFEIMLKKQNVNISIVGEYDIFIDTDIESFDRVLTILIENTLIHAFNDTTSNTIIIDVLKSNNSLIIHFNDNGNGIDNDSLNKIFDPFYTTQRPKGYTGLGLYLAYNLVTLQLQGDIQCNSQTGEGTTFTITIPFPEMKQ